MLSQCVCNQSGRTSLHYAVSVRHPDTVKLLLDKGIARDVRTQVRLSHIGKEAPFQCCSPIIYLHCDDRGEKWPWIWRTMMKCAPCCSLTSQNRSCRVTYLSYPLLATRLCLIVNDECVLCCKIHVDEVVFCFYTSATVNLAI